VNIEIQRGQRKEMESFLKVPEKRMYECICVVSKVVHLLVGDIDYNII
jgi:hypothetical protein